MILVYTHIVYNIVLTFIFINRLERHFKWYPFVYESVYAILMWTNALMLLE